MQWFIHTESGICPWNEQLWAVEGHWVKIYLPRVPSFESCDNLQRNEAKSDNPIVFIETLKDQPINDKFW